MQWKILQHKKADDFVISTDYQCSVRDFVEKTTSQLGFSITWKGKRIKRKRIRKKNKKKLSKMCKLKEGMEIISISKNISDL